MRDAGYIAMCFVHRSAKKLLGRYREPVGVRFVDVAPDDAAEDGTVLFGGLTAGANSEGADIRKPLSSLYPVENAVPPGSHQHLETSYTKGPGQQPKFATESFSPDLWRGFIERASIPQGYRNAGLRYAGYIASGLNSWCLPSWIWTNGAIVRQLCAAGDIEQARAIGDRLIALQEADGGWVVRSDYTVTEEIPVVAPNDSAYIANNACVELYKATGDDTYLHAARKCAAWIMECARPDGLVWTGYDRRTGTWLKEHTIVDTGFTAGLFARLVTITGDAKYREFLERFVARFIELFYDPATQCFATSVDASDMRVGGRFARGQAWALEGLIPAYEALQSEPIKQVAAANVAAIIDQQLSNGGWAYNFDKAYLGEDCKGVSVLAKALLDWDRTHPNAPARRAAQKALDWCIARTSVSGESAGGIFSFNSEGAVVHNYYTRTAFVYSSAYALECCEALAANG